MSLTKFLFRVFIIFRQPNSTHSSHVIVCFHPPDKRYTIDVSEFLLYFFYPQRYTKLWMFDLFSFWINQVKTIKES